jgi:hypothetical protein
MCCCDYGVGFRGSHQPRHRWFLAGLRSRPLCKHAILLNALSVPAWPEAGAKGRGAALVGPPCADRAVVVNNPPTCTGLTMGSEVWARDDSGVVQICSKICIREGRGERRPPPATRGDQGATDGADNGHMWNYCRGAWDWRRLGIGLVVKGAC